MTVSLKRSVGRRAVLRGIMQGAAVTVGLPFLDCFLNENGTALASGAPLPLRFGTWFWGLGHTPGRAISQKTGADFEFLEECAALTPFKKKINFFSAFNTPLDGNPNRVHHSGWVGCRTGTVPGKGGPSTGEIPAPTFDVLIADAIGGNTRFRALDVSSTGDPNETYSARGTYSRNAAEVFPVAFYTRVFGPEFTDPNTTEFKPDPQVMIRQSVLSAVNEQSRDFVKTLGSADKGRMDEYFTSIRELEQQFALQLEKPQPAEACQVPPQPVDGPVGVEIPTVLANHEALTKLLVMALACNQTKVFNMVYSQSLSMLRRVGESFTHHTLSHEEPLDPGLGYQREVAKVNIISMEALATFIRIFDGIREGDGTLLDNTLLVANTDTNFAKIHSLDGVPMMTIGSAGGRLKTGLHVPGSGDPITRVGLTAMRVMGLQVDEWGTRSLRTSKPIDEILM